MRRSPGVLDLCRWSLAAVGILVASCLAVAGPSVLSALRNTQAARAALDRAVEEIRRGDAGAARRQLTDAARGFDAAAAGFGSPWLRPARAVPLVGRQVETLRALARSGALGARAARISTEILTGRSGAGQNIHTGTVDLKSLRRVSADLGSAARVVRRAASEANAASRSWLLPPIAEGRAAAERALRRATDGIARATAALEAAPALLGAKGTRRYLVMSSNLSELRGTGGVLGFFAMIEADHGRLRLLPDSGRPNTDLVPLREARLRPPRWFVDTWGRYDAAQTWQNVNMTTDFPTAAKLIVEAVSNGSRPVDGIVQIDPYGLSALLSLTGPVDMPGWPERIGASNIARVAQHDLYVRHLRARERDAFGEQLIAGVFARVLASDVHLDWSAIQRLAQASAGGHIKMYVNDTVGQRALQALELDGGLPSAESATDVLGVFNENASPSKIDWFLRRSVSYVVELDPDGKRAEARLVVQLRNDAPPRGLPEYILGPNGGRIAPGENRTIVVLVRPPTSSLLGVRVDGRPVVASIDRERDLLVHQVTVTVPPGGTVRLEASYLISSAFDLGGGSPNYRLHVLRQPVVAPDRYDVRVIAPSPWTVSGAAEFRGELKRDKVLAFELSERASLHALRAIGAVLRLLAFW